MPATLDQSAPGFSNDAFENSADNSDIYHAEKRVREGNIGLTKTTELIESARSTLRWTVLDELFKDINEVLLIGLY